MFREFFLSMCVLASCSCSARGVSEGQVVERNIVLRQSGENSLAFSVVHDDLIDGVCLYRGRINRVLPSGQRVKLASLDSYRLGLPSESGCTATGDSSALLGNVEPAIVFFRKWMLLAKEGSIQSGPGLGEDMDFIYHGKLPSLVDFDGYESGVVVVAYDNNGFLYELTVDINSLRILSVDKSQP
ncbi:hypothetical protein V1318_13780 [Lysobacter sp. CCNWLW3]|uniref:hypothetical protein n=1 Tax=unclassified Lysobacter TaxID=2635362 RepID=UPI002FD1A4E7